MRKFLSLSVLLATGFAANAQNVIRGPYMQINTHESIQICWRTDVPTNSQVYYGSSPTSLVNTVDSTNLAVDHRVTISGLNPSTTYYYGVGDASGVLEGGADQYRFKTHPTPGDIEPFRVWCIGDFGKGNTGQMEVWRSYMEWTDTVNTDVWLWLGDNAYPDGTDQEYQDYAFTPYDSIMDFLPFYPTPGNHDYNSVNRFDPPDQHVGPYFDIVEVPTNGEAGGTPSGTELFYSFDYGNTHFISLNSEIQAWTASSSTPMTQWLEQDLQANDKEWVVAFFHQPPYSKGSHDTDDFWEILMIAMRQNILPILEDYGVDLVIGGHSHVYERSMLIKEHYNFSLFFGAANIVDGSSGNFDQGEHYEKFLSAGNEGTIYIVNGNSGSKDDDPDLDHPIMVATDGGNDGYGSFVFDVNGNRLDGYYITEDGDVEDRFTIIKPDGTTGSTVGIKPEESLPDVRNIQLFPNPVKENASITFDMMAAHDVSIFVQDVSGKRVAEVYNGSLSAGQHQMEFGDAVSELKAASYWLVIDYGDRRRTLGFTKAN